VSAASTSVLCMMYTLHIDVTRSWWIVLYVCGPRWSPQSVETK